MKLLLTQYYEFSKAQVSLEGIRQQDAWEILYLRGSETHKEETKAFLNQHLANDSLTQLEWDSHCLSLETRGISKPSFGWMRCVNPVQIVLGGGLQWIQWRTKGIVKVFEAEDTKKLFFAQATAESDDYWIVSASEKWYIKNRELSLHQHLQELQKQKNKQKLEQYWSDWSWKAGELQQFFGIILQIKAIVDLEDYNSTDYLRQRIKALSERTPVSTQILIDQFLRNNAPKKVGFWENTPSKEQYNALLSDFYAQKREIALLKQQAQPEKLAALQQSLETERAEMNSKIQDLELQLKTACRVQKGIDATEKELEDLKKERQNWLEQYANVQQQLKTAEARNESLRTEYSGALELLQLQLHEAQSALHNKTLTNTHLQHQIQQLQQQNIQFQSELYWQHLLNSGSLEERIATEAAERNALEKIHECKNDKLELKSLGLRRVPWEVNGLLALRKLDLYMNKIIDITVLQFLIDLEILDLESNELSDIEALSHLVHLTRLELASNQLRHIKALANLHQLNKLNLQKNKISDIEPLKGLQALTKLDLSYNLLVEIAPLQSLTQLKKLDLSHNLLEKITDLQFLTALEDLDLQHNQIQIFDLNLEALPKLKYLQLAGNPISNVPAEIVAQANCVSALRSFQQPQ